MSDELDDFLRQAAQRRQQRQQEKNKRAAPSAPAPNTPQQRSPYTTPQPSSRPAQPAPRPTQRSERPPVVAETVAPEIRNPISDFQATIDNRHVESDLSFADERMAEHVMQALGSDLSQRSSLSGNSGKKTHKKSNPRTLEPEKMSASAPTGAIQSSAMVSSLDLKQQLRDPQTLRLAIIAHEILRRPYQ
jgi:hypothetical protein